MLINCPKCSATYELNENLIPEQGKKLRCSSCGEVFVARREDLHEAAPRTEQAAPETITTPDVTAAAPADDSATPEVSTADVAAPTDTPASPAPADPMDDIFKRLSQQTEDLFRAEKELPAPKRLLNKLKQILGLQSKFARSFVLIGSALVFLLLSYNFRFEIVRTLPFLNYVYQIVGIKASVPGEGLEFQNVVWDDYEEDYVRKLEVKGFIVNTTAKDITIPQIHLEMLDKDGHILQSLNQPPQVRKLESEGRVAVGITIKKPSPLTKYIYLTFTD